MIRALLIFWIAAALLIVFEKKLFRIIIYLSIFSLLSAACFLLFAAPDVAMAEAVISAFSTIIMIVSFEKYYSYAGITGAAKKTDILKYVMPAAFTVLLFILFVVFIPGSTGDFFIKKQYMALFAHDVGGENAVTAVYLGYRMYDTLLEALMLLVSAAAVIHLSVYQDKLVFNGKRRDTNHSEISVFVIRIISPVLVLFALYLIINGHLTPGGGFQGGVVLASFFICRYMVYAIHDIPIKKVIVLEKWMYLGIMLLASFFVFFGINSFLSIPKTVYLIIMNLFIGIKVACGFLIIFYRFIAFEWRN